MKPLLATLIGIILIVFGFFALQRSPETFTVSRVIDGDTLVLSNGTTIRIAGIDAPEKDQPYGREATMRLQALTNIWEVTIKTYGEDKYGRTIAALYTSKDIGLDQIENGYAWHYPESTPDYSDEQEEARENQWGLWQDPQPVAPWEWRSN